MKQFTKLEAAQILKISLSTLKRRMATGQIKFTTAPQSRPGEVTVYFTAEQLGVPEPELQPQFAEPVRRIEPEPIVEHPVSEIAEAPVSDVESALRDTVFQGQHTLLGPMEPQPQPKPDCASHMTSPIPDLSKVERPLESDDWLELCHPGHKQRVAQMYRDAGIRPPSEQEKKEGVDRAVIAAGFRKVGR